MYSQRGKSLGWHVVDHVTAAQGGVFGFVVFHPTDKRRQKQPSVPHHKILGEQFILAESMITLVFECEFHTHGWLFEQDYRGGRQLIRMDHRFGNQAISSKGCSFCGCENEKFFDATPYQTEILNIYQVTGTCYVCETCRKISATRAVPKDTLLAVVRTFSGYYVLLFGSSMMYSYHRNIPCYLVSPEYRDLTPSDK